MVTDELLIKLKPQIELTKSEDGLGIGEREFAWIYKKDKLIIRLQEINDSLPVLFAGGYKNACEFKFPLNTNAIMLIHNHPDNDIFPSLEDLISFLKCISKNHRMDFNLIASTEGGIVGGYLLMNYTGERCEGMKLIERIEQKYSNLCDLRREEIKKYPSRFKHITWGDCIFSMDELRKMLFEILFEMPITNTFFPMPNYKLEDWRFVKE